MTAAEIVARLCDAKDFGITPKRVSKAKFLAARNRIDWADVLAAMSSEQRRQAEGHEG